MGLPGSDGSAGSPDDLGLREPPMPVGAGYDPGFLGVDLPAASPEPGSAADDAVLLEGRPWLPYEHFSVMLSSTRRLARQVAWNIDVATLRDGDQVSRSGLRFRPDPRIPADAQVLEDVYSGNRLDRGHLARRADLLWGTDEQAGRANRESFYFPNIAPQMDNFNQSRMGGRWGLLENSLTEYLRATTLPRASVFGGPELTDDDPPYRGVAVPRSFWKLLAYRVDGELRCRAFLLTQSLKGLETLGLDDDYLLHGIAIAELGGRLRLVFPDQVLAADRMPRGLRPGDRVVDDPYLIAW